MFWPAGFLIFIKTDQKKVNTQKNNEISHSYENQSKSSFNFEPIKQFSFNHRAKCFKIFVNKLCRMAFTILKKEKIISKVKRER